MSTEDTSPWPGTTQLTFESMEPYVGLPIIDQNGAICGVHRTTLKSVMAVEAYRDENGTVWVPPTAWAWAKLCKAHNLKSDEAEALLRRHDNG